MKRYGGFYLILWPLVGMFLFAVLFFVKQTGMQYSIKPSIMGFVPESVLLSTKPKMPKESIILFDSREPYSEDIFKNISFVLSSMSIEYDSIDLASQQFPDISLYRTVIMALANMDTVHQYMPDLFRWVNLGGRLMFAVSIEPTSALSDISSKLGMKESATKFTVVNKVRIVTDFMLGGKGNEYTWVGNNRYALMEQLEDDCTVHIMSVGDTEVPLLWERVYGSGKIIVNNNDAFNQKQSRGLIAAVYSLLDDICIYPVINASMFFIDDFPAPVSDGFNEWIYKNYGMSIDSFYTNIWFPSILKLGNKYGLSFTGMLLETYNDNVSGPFLSPNNTDRIKLFGDLLLDNCNEIGLHGYNHQPLVLESYSLPSTLNYIKWITVEDIVSATAEALRFSKELFPNLIIKTYIAPSYILSSEARKALKDRFPQITAISGTYLAFQDELANGKEFDIGKDGIINVPHLISAGYFNDDARWLALSEINFHYVNSLIINPTDMLDPEYGGKESWDNIQQNLQYYLNWLFDSAKGIRNLTAQESAMSTQRYCNLRVEKNYKDGKMNITLWGFYDEAWLMVRCNVGELNIGEGGTMVQLGRGLYLLHATSKNIELKIVR
jgi:hypothetical protein